MTEQENDPTTPSGRSGIAAAALIIMIGNVLSRLLGLGREQLASGLFGTGDPIAAFTIADNVHTLLFDLLVSGMLQAALVPVLAGWAAPDKTTRAEFRRISGALLTLVALIAGTVVSLGLIFAPNIVHVMTSLSGSSTHDAATFQLTITLVRLILPAIFFLGIGTILMATLYALERVTAPALAVAARNGMIVVVMLILSSRLGVKSIAIGIVIGGLTIALLQIPALRRADALPHLNFDFRHPAVKRVLRLYIPIFLGLLVNTVAVIIDRNLAWGAQRDALGAMRYATTLVQMVLGLVAAAISLAALPALSRHHAGGDEEAYLLTLGRALAMVTILIVPAVFGLAAVAKPAVALLFEHGETGPDGARLIVIALLGYLPGTLCAAYDQVLIFAFYARQNTRLPVLVGIAAVGVYFVVAFSLVGQFGMIGLVLANSAQFVSHLVLMIWLARREFGWSFGHELQRTVRLSLGAGIASASSAFLVWIGLAAGWPQAQGVLTVGREFVLVSVPVGIGAIVYLLLLSYWRVPELLVLRRAILGRFIPRFAD